MDYRNSAEYRESVRFRGVLFGERWIPGGHAATNAACRRMTPRNLTLSVERRKKILVFAPQQPKNQEKRPSFRSIRRKSEITF